MTKNKEPYILIKGENAEMTDKDVRHKQGLFKAKQKKLKSGKIIIELTPATKEEEHRKELIEEVAQKLKDNINKEELMKDVLADVKTKDLEMIDKALKRGAKVKAKEGCYYFKIKDPRRKKAFALRIRK